MADTPSMSGDTSQPKAPKDKNCPYCNQAFTSSSLGRHLDLYIKERNPKPPDGVHDVDAIKKLRGSITRRQPRGSLARRAASTPTGVHPAAGSKKSPASDAESSRATTPAGRNGSVHAEDSITGKFPFVHTWKSTGVINDLPKNGELGRDDDREGSQSSSWSSALPANPQRTLSRQVQKAQFDMKQKVQDALDTARAAELALRELLGSFRAAKQQVEMHSMPFDFDPLSLDFPALTLQCLKPPPTLFSSTQHPTPASWSISPPGHQQYEALRTYFTEEFRKWKIACETATTAANDELQYPPPATYLKMDRQEAIQRSLRAAETLEKQVDSHTQSTYAVWEGLPAERRSELWVLELARSVGRRQHEIERFKETHHTLNQENASLRSQIDQLNRLQQPREFKAVPPTTLPIGRDLIAYCMEEAAVHGRRSVGVNVDDRHLDLATVVSKMIERWKSVVVSMRSTGGMSVQRPLEQTGAAAPHPAGPSPGGVVDGNDNATATSNGGPAQTSSQAPQPQQHHAVSPLQEAVGPGLQGHCVRPNAPVPAAGVSAAAEECAPAAVQTAGTPSDPPSVATTHGNEDEDDEMSDQDAEAEIEDDDGLGYQAMNAAASQPHLQQQQPQYQQHCHQQLAAMPAQQTAHLDVPRARGAAPRSFAAGDSSAGMSANHAGHGLAIHGGMNLGGPVPSINMAIQGHGNQQLGQRGMKVDGGAGHGRIMHPDMAMAMQGVGDGEPMYTD